MSYEFTKEELALLDTALNALRGRPTISFIENKQARLLEDKVIEYYKR